MKRFLFGAAAAAALLAGTVAANAQAAIGIQVFDNGVLIGSTGLQTGGAVSDSFSDPFFSRIIVTSTGSPLTPFPDFGTVSTDISSVNLTTTHTLTILATQIQVGGGVTGDTFANAFTTNNLVGSANVSSVAFNNFVDAADGAFVEAHNIGADTFLGPVGSASGILGSANLSGLFSETMVMQATFGAGLSQIQTTDQITGVPEPSTWAMLLLGFVGLAFAFRNRRKIAGMGSVTA